ncbi:MAG TPA: arginyltransferase [Armatimonadota bacterium]|nr:arginyltransferase [Armatimonadota bacterium]
MIILRQFITEPHECPYLPDRLAILEYRVAAQLSPADYEEQMNRGFRKFGSLLFRPVCEGCSECRPIRIPVQRFRPDRSQRRAWKRNQDLRVVIQPPTADADRLDLYHRYHAFQARRKGWPEKERDAAVYEFSFVQNPLPGVEISIWEGSVLRAITLTEVTPYVVSGIYHYYDPETVDRSLGTYCMLQTIELARRLRRRWAYFGFYVEACASLSYKSRFRPCEIMDSSGGWREAPVER